MAVFVIERRFAEAIDLSEEDVREINLINDEEDVRWLYSFLSVDRRKTYCLVRSVVGRGGPAGRGPGWPAGGCRDRGARKCKVTGR